MKKLLNHSVLIASLCKIESQKTKGRGLVKENRMLPIGTETFRIFVDEAEDGVIRGRVSGGTLPEETLFRSLSRLILLLEEQLDTGGAPKASPIKCTETPTFELDILFRQNYSWQGRLRWTKGGKEAAFRSVLELLIQMETVLAQ